MKIFEEDAISGELDLIAELLLDDGVMIYPTDTIAGLGCLGNNSNAVKKIFTMKRRSYDKPLSYAFASRKMVEKYVEIPTNIKPLFSLLPGPLTLILPTRHNADPIQGTQKNTIGVRIPNTPWLLELINKLNVPIAATSANLSNSQPVNRFEEVSSILIKSADIIVKWKNALPGIASTIVSFKGTILRRGAILDNQVCALLKMGSKDQKEKI